MAFGKKAKNLKAMRKSLKESKNRGGLAYIGSDGLEVRFLTEPEEWIRYSEAYSPSMRKGWPVPEDDAPDVPDARVSTRYAANVLDIKNDKVIALKMPVTLVDLLTARAEKRGTITDTDLELYKAGEGMDTTYGFDPLDKIKRNLKKYELLDIEKILQSEYDRVWGDDDDDEEEESPRPKRRGSRRAADFDPDEEDEDDEDDEDEDDLYEDDEDEDDLDDDDEDEDDLDDDEDEDEEDDEEDDEDVWTRSELEELTLAELRKVAKENEIDTRGLKKAELVDAIMGD